MSDETLDLFAHQPYNGTPPYARGSDTSEQAAVSAPPNAGTKRRRIYDLIVICGGATDDELEDRTGWRHQTVSARRRELVLSGLVVDSGKRRTTRSGRKAVVWSPVR